LLLQAIGYLLYLQMNNDCLCDRLYWYADINYHLWLVDDSWMSTAYLVFMMVLLSFGVVVMSLQAFGILPKIKEARGEEETQEAGLGVHMKHAQGIEIST
jgi:hypothetical protein